MGKRALMFIPNTPALTAWGQKPMTRHLSNLINGRTEGNILNSKALLSAYEQGNQTIMLEHSHLAIEFYNFKFRRSP